MIWVCCCCAYYFVFDEWWVEGWVFTWLRSVGWLNKTPNDPYFISGEAKTAWKRYKQNYAQNKYMKKKEFSCRHNQTDTSRQIHGKNIYFLKAFLSENHENHAYVLNVDQLWNIFSFVAMSVETKTSEDFGVGYNAYYSSCCLLKQSTQIIFNKRRWQLQSNFLIAHIYRQYVSIDNDSIEGSWCSLRWFYSLLWSVGTFLYTRRVFFFFFFF